MNETKIKLLQCVEKWQMLDPSFTFVIKFFPNGQYEIMWGPENSGCSYFIRPTKDNPKYEYASSHNYDINLEFMECLGLTLETCKVMINCYEN
jgi:hypothetical protein